MMLFGSNSCARHTSFPSIFYLLFAFAAFFQFSVLATPTPVAELEKRVGKPDSFDAQKIVEWLEKNKPADPSKLIFYTDVSVGKPMAANFVAHNPDYGYFYSIYGAAFARDMGLVNGVYPPQNLIAMSKAMGLWATGDARVFNSQRAKPDAYWVQYEMPNLKERSEVKHIYAMRDNAVNPSDFGLDIKH